MFCLILFAQGNLSIKICQKGKNPGKHLFKSAVETLGKKC